MLELVNVGRTVDGAVHLADIDLAFERGSLNVLLGPTLSGKTSLMRVMAGLDRPTRGTVRMDGRDVTGMPVQKRDVAMVYQQFINYPSMTVYENIASPLRIRRAPKDEIEREVARAADLLKLTPYLDRTPLNLSGGQQQRTALARAIVKNADLVLLDEPLANLDYKLREELRIELPRIFAESGTIFVYATTEPSEALLLGGSTATLHEGRVTQFGPTVEVYRQPSDLRTAQTFADPPLNVLDAARLPDVAATTATLAVRPHHVGVTAGEGRLALEGRVDVTEITGSETFVHATVDGRPWVALLHGIHHFEADQPITLHADIARMMAFDAKGRALTVRESA